MGRVIAFPTELAWLACDDCGSPVHKIHVQRHEGVTTVRAIECSKCGKRIELTEPEKEPA